HSRGGHQIDAGFAPCRSALGHGRSGSPARDASARARQSVSWSRSLDVRFSDDGAPAQSVSDTTALTQDKMMTSLQDLIVRLGRLDACAISDALDALGLTGVVTGIHRLSSD